jgi:hypothetical protein
MGRKPVILDEQLQSHPEIRGAEYGVTKYAEIEQVSRHPESQTQSGAAVIPIQFVEQGIEVVVRSGFRVPAQGVEIEPGICESSPNHVERLIPEQVQDPLEVARCDVQFEIFQ